jgi:hypothetical protein
MSVFSKHAIAGAALLVGLALSGGSAQASLTLVADSSAPVATATDEPIVAESTATKGSDAMAAGKTAPSQRTAKRTTPRYRVASQSQPHYASSSWRPSRIVHGVAY